jgi:hypothetical protein
LSSRKTGTRFYFSSPLDQKRGLKPRLEPATLQVQNRQTPSRHRAI